jgi:hypothetical protein
MKSPTRLLFLAAAAAGVGLGVAALVAQPGCSSNCNTICPANYVYIGSPDGMTQVPITGIYLGGPSCPPTYSVTCVGTPQTGGCTHLTLTGQQPGLCDVGLTFSDRPSEVVHLEFGEIKNCCPGYPVVGDSSFFIPADPTMPIYGANHLNPDAVMIVVDGGADGAGDAGTEAGTDATGDAPADAGDDASQDATDDGAADAGAD